MIPQFVDYIGFDGNHVITREKWQLTPLHCPRCGNGDGHVWAMVDPPPPTFNEVPMRLFICIGCGHVGSNWDGFRPAWNAKERAKQIIKFAFSENASEETA